MCSLCCFTSGEQAGIELICFIDVRRWLTNVASRFSKPAQFSFCKQTYKSMWLCIMLATRGGLGAHFLLGSSSSKGLVKDGRFGQPSGLRTWGGGILEGCPPPSGEGLRRSWASPRNFLPHQIVAFLCIFRTILWTRCWLNVCSIYVLLRPAPKFYTKCWSMLCQGLSIFNKSMLLKRTKLLCQNVWRCENNL
jgi:hypothetical protein